MPLNSQLSSADGQQNDDEQKQLMAIRRALQGQMNRTSENNVEAVFNQIESVYQQYPRNHVNNVLFQIIRSSLAGNIVLLDDFIIVYALLISLVYHVVGHDSGAVLVQKVAELCHLQLSGIDASDMIESQVINMVSLLGHLYLMKVVGANLIYDFLTDCISGDNQQLLSEQRVEVVLKLLKICGGKLRSQDATGLKDFIILFNSRLSLSNGVQSERLKFLVEMVNNIKNNKISKQSRGAEDRLSKLQRNLLQKRSINPHEPLRCSLNDILNVKSKGAWWIIGAPWVGNQYTAGGGDNHQPSHAQSDSKQSSQMQSSVQKLQKKLNINTDLRRQIFSIFMECEDYIDAHEKLMKLGLKDRQEREIVRMILYCCQKEKIYNPFYGALAERLCQSSHSHKVTLQYAIWDFIKELQSTSNVSARKISHVANLTAQLIKAYSLSMSVLKVIDFSSALSAIGGGGGGRSENGQPSKTCFFLQIVLIQILYADPYGSENYLQIEKLFNRLGVMSELAQLKQGLILVMKDWIRKRSRSVASSEARLLVEQHCCRKYSSDIYLDLKQRIKTAQEALLNPTDIIID
ncbi:hypothetical protein MIR68_000859 [Amoeboaphelidium protococcarum]|nr:hypothetical protein MIR68_000859 [Amoeboaphelidium protococcarum]